MTRKIVGLFATVALLGSGVALANGDKQAKTQSSQQAQPPIDSTPGGSLQGQTLGEKEVSGTVLKSSGDELKLRTENGVISLNVNKETRFQDAHVKRAKDIKEGQQVRTSFTVDKNGNVAKSISLDSGMGGSGLETDPGINQGLDPQPGLDTQGLDSSGQHQSDNQDLHQGMNPTLGGTGEPSGKTY